MIRSICCIGAGYVGGPTMAVIALKCPHINITVVDSNSKRIKAWNGPLENLPIFEPGLSEVIEKTRGRNLFFSNDIKGAIENSEMIFMAVNTPTKTEGEGAGMAADLRYIESCAMDIAKYSNSDKIVVEKSTVPIRTAEKIKEILGKNENRIRFEILSNPEFLAEGTAINDMINPDRILIGGDKTESGQKAIQKLVDIYANWIPKKKILTTNIWSSELSKLASNAILAQRISSINSLSALCEKTGADIDELSKAIGMDHRIGPHFLKASVGFGGSCFQKDILNLVYLCKYYGLNEVGEYWHQVVKINDYQKQRFAQKVIDYFKGGSNGLKIAILGWAFKANTSDTRESAAISVTTQLLKAGFSISVFDPQVSKKRILEDLQISLNDKNVFKQKEDKIKILTDLIDLIASYDAYVIITDWEIFKRLDWKNIAKEKPVFDGRNILNLKTNNYYKL